MLILAGTAAAAVAGRPGGCDLAVSRLVRESLEREVRSATGSQGYEWPAGCPFHPSQDGATCLADYCDMFGVCNSQAPDACYPAHIASERRQCDAAVARCFPLGDAAARSLHVRFSRSWCQVLHCGARDEWHRSHEEGHASLPAVVAGVLIAGACAFACVLQHVERTGPACRVVLPAEPAGLTLLGVRRRFGVASRSDKRCKDSAEPLAAYAASPGPLLPELGGRLVLAVHHYQWSGPGRFLPNWSVPRRWGWALRLLRFLGAVSKDNYGDMDRERLREQLQSEWGDILDSGTCPVAKTTTGHEAWASRPGKKRPGQWPQCKGQRTKAKDKVWVSEFGADLSNPEEVGWLRDFTSLLAEKDVDWAYWPLNVGPKPGCGEDEAYGVLDARWRPKMLDLVTLLSAVGLQEELAESRKASPVITAAESSTTSFVEDAAEQISLALESFEGALSSALGAATGSSSSEPAPGPAPCKTV
ncbi:unnamed protein product [Prorocentrum cordatum]|uniref:Cellulase n=1 Tax=Prorocentrum cordatum TaxID=2364126 RepID=A0ABN9RB34_9DINO|nr:unnamed protein product [Polarella glacialis]